nr:MAG TPA: transcriptional regulator [Caudoviricetes sp.]
MQMLGKRFGYLTVLEECEERKHRAKVYHCICDCGKHTNVVGYSLRSGRTKSCGCLNYKPRKGHIKHGKTGTRLYNIWKNMHTRCYNEHFFKYEYYGGRGIKVCDEWLHDFMAFYNWAMNNGYKDNLTIDRIDVNGNYEPNNCRWVDMKTQLNNKSDNVLLTYNKKTQTIAQWADELGVPYGTIQSRHYRGFTDKECLFGKER